MDLNEATFPTETLTRIDTSKMVILNSGGPLMTVVKTLKSSRMALCEWECDGETNAQWFEQACLSRLVPFNAPN